MRKVMTSKRTSELITLEEDSRVYRGLKKGDRYFDILTYDYEKARREGEDSMLVITLKKGTKIIPLPGTQDIMVAKNSTLFVSGRKKMVDGTDIYYMNFVPKEKNFKSMIKDKVDQEDIERYGVEDAINIAINSLGIEYPDDVVIEELKGELE